MKVLKFGGTSVGDVARIRSVLDIIAGSWSEGEPLAVVVSAMAKVTDQLVAAGRLAFRGDQGYRDVLRDLEFRHRSVAEALLGPSGDSASLRFIRQAFGDLEEFIRGIFILGEITPRTTDYVMSYGEQLSCTIVAEALAQRGIAAEYVDARKLIRTDLAYGAGQVNFDLTNWNLINHFRNRTGVQVVTGFIACGPENETTTLGRGGSDYTASIVGAALEAEEIEIWTDVDGVMTADPRKVSEAMSVSALTFEEALELSHFGAKVIHPPTMLPALKKRIPIRIRNSFHPAFPGTFISDRASSEEGPVKGIASLEGISLLKVTGEGILRTAGIAARIFAALARRDIEVALVTQSSSEHSVCLAIASERVREAREVVEIEFRVEMHHGQISCVTVENDCAIVAVVGEQVQHIPGVTGRVFDALGRNGITPRAIAHGSSERNLTVALRQADLGKAMNALHDHLFLSRRKTLNLFLLGPGLVGSALLDLLREQDEYARTSLRTRFRVCGIANSRKMHFDEHGIDLGCWRDQLASSASDTDLDAFTATVRRLNAANSIVIDCTGVESVVAQYLPLLESSVSIITSSKVANTLSQDFYRQLRAVAHQNGAQFRYSTNVGAALPIVDSIKSIVQSGDTIEQIEGVLSGTLSFIFNSLNAGLSFSEAVREARERGYTEPDPRVDLEGTDMARKLVILAREAGGSLEMRDVRMESYLPPEALASEDLDAALRQADGLLEERRQAALARDCTLMYTARYDGSSACVGLREIPQDHPFHQLSGNDNIVSLTTRSLYIRPLVVRGGGAGARLTASGIFNDIVHVSHFAN